MCQLLASLAGYKHTSLNTPSISWACFSCTWAKTRPTSHGEISERLATHILQAHIRTRNMESSLSKCPINGCKVLVVQPPIKWKTHAKSAVIEASACHFPSIDEHIATANPLSPGGAVRSC